MANPYQLKTLRNTVAADSRRIATLIGDLSRTVEVLTVDIEHEEKRARVNDVSDLAYPVLARSLRERRENLRVTISSLAASLRGTPKAA
jgi:hypothetical protein